MCFDFYSKSVCEHSFNLMLFEYCFFKYKLGNYSSLTPSFWRPWDDFYTFIWIKCIFVISSGNIQSHLCNGNISIQTTYVDNFHHQSFIYNIFLVDTIPSLAVTESTRTDETKNGWPQSRPRVNEELRCFRGVAGHSVVHCENSFEFGQSSSPVSQLPLFPSH